MSSNRSLRNNSTAPSLWPDGREERAQTEVLPAPGIAPPPPNRGIEEANREIEGADPPSPPEIKGADHPPPPANPAVEDSDSSDDDRSTNMATAPVEVWKLNPLQGDFNPGTKLGKDIFLEKSKGLPENERFDLTRANATSIRQYFEAREANMEGCLDIPVKFNPDGTVKTTKNLLTQYHSIKLEDCQRAAHANYGEKLAPTNPIPDAPFKAKDFEPGNG